MSRTVGAAFALISIGPDGSIPMWVVGLWSYPVRLVALSSLAWRLFVKRRYLVAAIISELPIMPVLGLLAINVLPMLIVPIL